MSEPQPLPYPEPGVYWVKLKIADPDYRPRWLLAKFGESADHYPWLVLCDHCTHDEPEPGFHLAMKHSEIAEVGPRVLPPGINSA